MHVFLRWVFPSAFCKLGDEWMPKQVAPKSVKNIGGTAFGFLEIVGLLLLDVLLVFVIIGTLSAIMALIDSAYGVFGWIFDWFNP
jgi:hypothetical protein